MVSNPYQIALKRTGLFAVGNIGRRGLLFLLLPLYTAYLDPADLGALALLVVSGEVLARLVTTPLVVGGVMRFYYHPDYEARRGVLLFSAGLVLTVLVLLLAGAWVLAAEPIARWLLPADGAADPVRLTRLYALVVLVNPLGLMLLMFVKLRAMARYFAVVALVSAAGTLAVVFVGLHYLDLGLEAAVWGFVAGPAVTVVLALPVFVRHARFRFDPDVLAGPLRFGVPLLPTGLARLVMQLGDRYVLRALVPAASLGLYDLGYRVGEGLDTVVGTPAYDAVSPTIRQLEARPDEQRRFIRSATTLYYGLALLAGLALALFAREILLVLARRPEFHPAWVIVPVVVFAMTQQVLGSFLEWGLVMRNKAVHLSGILIASAAVNVGLNLALIPLMGIMGAAVATLGSVLLWNGLRLYYSARFYDLRFEVGRLSLLTLLAAGVYVVSLAVAPLDGLGATLAVKAGLWVAFPGLCLATRLVPWRALGLLTALWRRSG